MVAVLSTFGALIIVAILGTWNPWIILGTICFLAPLFHFSFICRRSFAFMLFLPALFSFQYIVSSAYCSTHPLYMMLSHLILSLGSKYFPLAALCAWALYLGVVLPIHHVEPIGKWHRKYSSVLGRQQRYVKVLEVTFWVGVAVRLASRYLSIIPGTAFFWLVISNLSFVAVVGLGVTQSRNFVKLLCILFLVLVEESVKSTIFNPFLFFALTICCTIVYVGKRWTPKKVVLTLLVASFSVYTLQVVKTEYRALRATPGQASSLGIITFMDTAMTTVLHPSSLFAEKNVGPAMSRFDQSQVISMIMNWVPRVQPYARGETITGALFAALVPRIIDPGKHRAGGVYFQRFTGMRLPPDTSINLGQMGDFYANFGPTGTVISCFLYAFLLGLIWRWFHNRAMQNPFWWAWFPFIAIKLVKTEDGVGALVNYAFKSAVVAFLVIRYVPEWKEVLNVNLQLPWKRKRSRKKIPAPAAGNHGNNPEHLDRNSLHV